MSYGYSRDQERFHGTFETLKEAVAEAVAGETEPFNFLVCESHRPKSASYYLPSAADFLEQMSERAADDCGEAAEDFMYGVPADARAQLQVRLSVVIDEWAKEHGLQPTFWHAENIRGITWEEAQQILSA